LQAKESARTCTSDSTVKVEFCPAALNGISSAPTYRGNLGARISVGAYSRLGLATLHPARAVEYTSTHPHDVRLRRARAIRKDGWSAVQRAVASPLAVAFLNAPRFVDHLDFFLGSNVVALVGDDVHEHAA
jgi:hypothetical protein